MRPIDIATAETAKFIQSHVEPGSHILEVGCGDGELALGLLQNGYEVTALDADPERVAKARALGVRTLVATWPKFNIAPVDAIVFTRSLHHISPLPAAVERAQLLLRPAGFLLIEDFAVEEMTARTLTWFRERVRSEPLATHLEPHHHSFVTELIVTEEPMKTWREHHTAHEVQPFGALNREIAQRFPVCQVERVPYLFRYLVSILPDTIKGSDLVRRFLQTELEAAGRNEIELIGRRITARPFLP